MTDEERINEMATLARELKEADKEFEAERAVDEFILAKLVAARAELGDA